MKYNICFCNVANKWADSGEMIYSSAVYFLKIAIGMLDIAENWWNEYAFSCNI